MSKPIWVILFLILVLVSPGLTSADDYYIHPNGSDITGNGSQVSPWATLSHACSQARKDGDIIHINAGSYTESSRCDLAIGVSILGAGPDKSIINSSYSDWLIRLESDPLVDGKQELASFKIDGQDRALAHGILVTGRHNVKVHDIIFEEIDSVGLSVGSALGFLNRIEVYNCNFRNCGKDFEGGSTGCLSISHLDSALIHHIIIQENRGYGIKSADDGWLRGVKLYNCDITVPSYDVTWGADIAIELWNLYDDCEIYNNRSNSWFSFDYGNRGSGAKSVRVHNNIIVFERKDNPKEAFEVGYGLSDVEIYNNYVEQPKIGVAIWGELNMHQSNILIHNNVFFNEHNGDGVFIQSRGATYSDIKVYNNVFDGQNSALAIDIRNRNGQVLNTEMKNNIVMNADNVLAALGVGSRIVGTIISYNNLLNVNEIIAKWGVPTTNTIIENNRPTDPGLVESGQRPDPYYRPLSETSSVVDAGTDVGLPFLASGPDIGRYEYGDTEGDGIPDQEEWGPDSLDVNYDGDGDGIADSQQSSVASFHGQGGLCYVTLASPAGTTLTNCRAVPPPAGGPTTMDFPYGFFTFTVRNAKSPPVETAVKLYLAAGVTPTTYYKYGPAPSDPNPHWYEFRYDGETGAEISNNVVTLHFVDGRRGDDVPFQDGMIVDQGGPGRPNLRNISTSINGSGGSSNSGGSSGGGGGGCFIDTAASGYFRGSHERTVSEFSGRFPFTIAAGTALVKLGGMGSPQLSELITKHDTTRTAIRSSLSPIVGLSWITLEYGDLQSLASVLLFFALIMIVLCRRI